MNDLNKQLKKIGLKNLDLENLFAALPVEIWVTVSSKNIKRQRCYFMLQIKNKKYTLFFYTEDREEGAVVLNKESGFTPNEAVGKMLVFIDQSGLGTPIVE